MSNHRTSFYSRLKFENELPQHTRPTSEPLQHNLDVRKLRRRCCCCISAALFIAFVLWAYNPTPGLEPPRNPENTHTQLKFVLVVHRHGARSAIHRYAFEEDIEWNVPPGMLLDVGFQGGFQLGKHLRNKYWDRLPAVSNSSVECISSNVNRTIDTARSVLIGLFTDNTTEPSGGNCSCRPETKASSPVDCAAKCIGVKLPQVPEVKVWDEESGNDSVLRQTDLCKEFGDLKTTFFNSSEFKNAVEDQFASQFEYIKGIVDKDKVTEINPDDSKEKSENLTPHSMSRIWDSVQCLIAQNGTKNGPYDNVTDVYEKLLPVKEWFWHNTYTNEAGPSAGGQLLNQIIANLKEAITLKPGDNSPQGNLMILYSAHDSTVAGLLAAMGVSDWPFPTFTSHIIFELYGPTDSSEKATLDNHNVFISFNDDLLKVGNCNQEFCRLNVFLESMKDRVQTKEDCVRSP